jgi:predicted dehydrogenase
MALISMEAAVSPPVIAAALESGAHVMAEKPSCVHARDFRPLVALAEGSSTGIEPRPALFQYMESIRNDRT